MQPARHSQIRDKQKLFKKLFISASLSEPINPPILVSPNFINLLLQQSSGAEKEYRKQILSDILDIFSQRPTNSLLLCYHDEDKVQFEKCILDNLVFAIMHVIDDQDQMELYLEKIGIVLAYYRVKLRNFVRLTQWLSKASFLESFQHIKFLFIVRVMKLYYSQKLGQSKSPTHYFYLFGNQNQGIQPVQHSITEFTLKHDLCLTLTFNSQGPPFKPSNILFLKTQRKQQIHLSYNSGTIKLSVYNDTQFVDEIILIKQLSEQVWYRILLNLNVNQTQFIIGNQVYKYKAMLRRERDRRISGCVVGKEWFGMIGGVMISNKGIGLDKFDMVNYPYGVDSINDLKSLNKTSIPAHVITSCFPFFTFQVRQTMHCFDVFKRNHSSISENIVIVGQPISQQKIDNLGGCKLILPLFYLIRFYQKTPTSNLLQSVLQLLLQILKTYNLQHLQHEFEQTHFLQILGQHLSDIPHFQTTKTINIIFNIYKILRKEKSKLIFIHDVIWMLNVGIDMTGVGLEEAGGKDGDGFGDVVEEVRGKDGLMSPTRVHQNQVQQMIKDYYKRLLSLYETDSKLAFQSMSVAEIVYWAVQHIEADESMTFSCCLQHHLNQSVLSYEMGVQQFIKLDNSHSRTHYQYIQQILSKCLQNQLKSATQNLPQVIKTLLRLFLQKYSSCFYLTILKSIRAQIDNKVPSKTLIKLLTDPNVQLISFLIFLSQKTINPDIISQILYIALFVQQYLPESRKEEITKFVLNLFRINKTIEVRMEKPVSSLVRKIRKSSLFIHKQGALDEEEGQQQVFEYKNSKIAQKLKKTNSLPQLWQFKSKKIQISQHRLTRIIARCPKPEHLSTYEPVYNIVINQLTGNFPLSTHTQSLQFSDHSIHILSEYYKLCRPQQRQSILLHILSCLQMHPPLKYQNSLTIFLLQSLKQSLYSSPEQTKNLLTIFTCIFSQILSEHHNIIQYYCSIKYLKMSRAAVSVILPHVLSKVIKLADLSQLFQFGVIGLYEVIQLSGDSAVEIVHMVLGEIHSIVRKNVKLVNKKIVSSAKDNLKKGQKQQQKEVQIWQLDVEKDSLQIYEQFSKIMCSHHQKEINMKLNDPFDQQTQQNMIKNSIITQKKESLTQIQNEAANTKDNFLSPEVQIERKVSSPRSPGQKKLKRNQSSNKQTDLKENTHVDRNYKQLSAIELYIRLFFTLIDKLEANQFQEKGQKNNAYKRESIRNMETNSLLKKSKSAEICYSYQFKMKDVLFKQFLGTLSMYIEALVKDINVKNKSHIKFLLSYVLYKALRNNQTDTQGRQICCEIFRNLWVQVRGLIQKDGQLSTDLLMIESFKPSNKSTLIQFFTLHPFPFSLESLFSLSQPSNSSQLLSSLNKILLQQPQMLDFFIQIQDLHDLITVGLYQKGMKRYVEDYQSMVSQYSSQKSLKNIQKLFDSQNIAEEKARITFLYENQCKFRKYHFQWDKMWSDLRVYHQPYGFWMAQKFKDNAYTYPAKSVRNFKFEMSEYSTKSGNYPMLQAKMLQSWLVVKDNKIKKNKYINSFSQMMKPSHIKLQKSNSQNNILTNMWRGMLGLSKKKNHVKLHEYDVVFICRSTKAAGKLFIQNKQDIIFCYDGARQEDTHLSFQKFSLAFNRQTYQKWCIYSVQKIRTHRYLLRYQALQLILNDGRSLIFNFINGDKDSFIKQLEKIQKQKLQAHNQKLYKLNKVAFFDDEFFDLNKGFDMKITEAWMKREISNLEYLTKVNRAASRGIYDLSQYMVVPWVVQFRKEKEPKFRDLTKTMGGLGSEERKKIISEKYYTKDPFNPYPPFFFGTHYSSPGVVFNILIRLSPYTQYCKHLQGGKFDIPDRLFASLLSAWRSASEEVSDVRELIPQIYYLPELLINIDQNYFGYTQTRELINHVEIPPWGANNPYFFVSQLRQLIESEEVSQKINEWIDLIFGYKQKGKQAQQNYNIYYYLTYEDYVDAQEEEDDVYKKSKQAQIVHFGQIPPQLFDRPHPRRPTSTQFTLHQLKFTRTITLMTSLKQKPIGLKLTATQLLLCKRNQLQQYSTLSQPAVLQKKKKFNFQKSLSQTYYLMKKQRSNIVYMQKQYFIIWGYMSNQFRIFNKNTGEIEEEDQMEARICSLIVNEAEDLVLVGLGTGVLVVYQLEYGVNDVFVKRIASECFPAPVTHISEFDGFFCITFGNYCAIYKIHRSLHYLTSQPKPKPTLKFFRSFSNPLPLKQCFLCNSPLYSIILTDNSTIKSYSLNGQLIKSIQISGNIKHYGRFKDHQLQDIFYVIDEDKAIALSIPDLRNVSILQFKDYQNIIENYLVGKNFILQVGYGAV